MMLRIISAAAMTLLPLMGAHSADELDLSLLSVSEMSDDQLHKLRGKNGGVEAQGDVEAHEVFAQPVAVSDQKGTSAANDIEGTVNGGANNVGDRVFDGNIGHVTLIQNTGNQNVISDTTIYNITFVEQD